MNYDSRTPPRIRLAEAGTDFFEPDCSPHPFDILAMFSLYQRVPQVFVRDDQTRLEEKTGPSGPVPDGRIVHAGNPVRSTPSVG